MIDERTSQLLLGGICFSSLHVVMFILNHPGRIAGCMYLKEA